MKTLILCTLVLWTTISWSQQPETIHETPELRIEKVSANTYLHVSYMETEAHGKFDCNGMILVSDGEALILDTPASDPVSAELIRYVRDEMKLRIKGVVVHHFHEDCLGGLTAFHELNLPSFASQQTIDLAWENGLALPQFEFDTEMELSLGREKVLLFYPGAGHTRDNIVSYFPPDKVLFGGCLIKATGSGKGNLADADPDAWAASVQQVKKQFGTAKIIVPGHGKTGGPELLDQTIKLFEKK